MSTPTWIDCCNYDTNVGDVRYLVEVLNTSSGRTSFSLNERPLRTNRSLQPRLWGWCGETDNRSRYARGVVRIASVNQGGRSMPYRPRHGRRPRRVPGDGRPSRPSRRGGLKWETHAGPAPTAESQPRSGPRARTSVTSPIVSGEPSTALRTSFCPPIPWALMVALLTQASPHCPKRLKGEIRALLQKGFQS